MSDRLIRRIPPILRAREFRLYTAGGRRLVDLWQCGGGAILGHTPPGVLREVKNAGERGLFAPVPHPLENRFFKALARIFAGGEFRVYASEGSLRRGLAEGGYIPHPETPFPDPALPGAESAGLSLWRPFVDEGDPLGGTRTEKILIPVLPWILAPQVAVMPALGEKVFLPPSDMMPPVILAGAARSVYDLIAGAPDRGAMHFPALRKALRDRKWRLQGIYLRYGEPLEEEVYAELFLRFLEAGFVLPPNQNLPAILPGTMSPGEEAKLTALVASC